MDDQGYVRGPFGGFVGWLTRLSARVNSVCFSLIWTTAPILVSVLSFFTYVYVGGRELTVGTAFTAISLFGMLRQPLNTLPMFIISVLQVRLLSY